MKHRTLLTCLDWREDSIAPAVAMGIIKYEGPAPCVHLEFMSDSKLRQ